MRARSEAAYAVSNRRALSQILRELVAELGGGSEKKAAGALGISQPTLNRLRNGKRSSMSRRVADSLYRGVRRLKEGKVRERQFMEVVLNPGAAIILDFYAKYQHDRLGSFRIMPQGHWCPQTEPRVHPHDVGMGGKPFHWELDELLWRMRQEAPTEFARLERTLRNQPRAKARLVALRIFEPLLEHSPSHFVERAGYELEPAEFKAFVRAGLTRERILLKRSPDPQRALEVQRRISAKYANE